MDFGTRFCPLCEREIDARVFGAHIFTEHEDELERSPDRIPQVTDALANSLDVSIAVAEDASETEAADRLRATRDAIRSLGAST